MDNNENTTPEEPKVEGEATPATDAPATEETTPAADAPAETPAM